MGRMAMIPKPFENRDFGAIGSAPEIIGIDGASVR